MVPPRILVAGIGNIFLGDDAFGVEVAQRLLGRPQPEGVRVVDFGIRGFDLALALQDGWEGAILVDALSRGGKPGTLYILEPDLTELESLPGGEMIVETHSMDPRNVIRLIKSMGGQFPILRIVGCEPANFGSEEDPAMGLSETVQAAVPEAVTLVEGIVLQFIRGTCKQMIHITQTV